MSTSRSILTLSDVHLGNRNTPAETIINNLKVFFKNFDLKDNFDDLKAIFIAGDLWDDALQFSSEVLPGFFRFWHLFTMWCYRKKIILRVLEGTPKHDRLQGATIAAFTEVNCPDLDFKYVKDLSIEYIPDLAMNVLYVPDECRHTADQCYNDVLELMREQHLSQVDIAIMHGMFKCQLGDIPMNDKLRPKLHDEELYLSIVEHFVSIGHVHTRLQYKRIFAQGSFDRISHGESLPKGAWYFKDQGNNKWLPIFLENKGAKQYVTVEIDAVLSLEKALKKIDKEIGHLPMQSAVRIAAPSGHDIHQAYEKLRLSYPFFIFTKKVLKEKEEIAVPVPTQEASRGVSLNRQTIVEAIFDVVNLNNELTPSQSKQLYAILEETHN